MSRKGKLRCSNCTKKRFIVGVFENKKIGNNVRLLEILSDTGHSGLRGRFICNTCKHTWVSSAMAATREIRKTTNNTFL